MALACRRWPSSTLEGHTEAVTCRHRLCIQAAEQSKRIEQLEAADVIYGDLSMTNIDQLPIYRLQELINRVPVLPTMNMVISAGCSAQGET